ncbi:hypothetical protein A0H81_10766 [Grifola frondosa]|uniref:Uncharacterized protein n=1 Tax=Grifola frondosa TaxID=5627 RepID=A0A1C7M203_GRIFR|nr:hypothetical protein A0H81_10766 [Grifola frondosa]
MPSLRAPSLLPPSCFSLPALPFSYQSGCQCTRTRTRRRRSRRSSGSDTHTRRVLADIDWWRVQDGQLDEPPSPSRNRDTPAPRRQRGAGVDVDDAISVIEGPRHTSIPTFWQPSAGMGTNALDNVPPSVPFWAVAVDESHGTSSPESLSPLPEFADLSISPRTPRRRRSSRSSASSLESSPESDNGSLFPMPTFTDLLSPSLTVLPPASASGRAARPSRGRVTPPLIRASSYSAVEFQISTSRRDDRFDDIPMPQLPFFSTATIDPEDLFYY